MQKNLGERLASLSNMERGKQEGTFPKKVNESIGWDKIVV